jgi:hypothetical protein
MGTRDEIQTWIEGYLRAWDSNNPEDIGSLFSKDAVYKTGPFDDPWQGREQIIQGWIERKDDPGSWSFEYDVLGAEGRLGVVRGLTKYKDPDQVFSNIWLITLNDVGNCTEFNEWKMEKK